jgi:hypothetical protein
MIVAASVAPNRSWQQKGPTCGEGIGEAHVRGLRRLLIGHSVRREGLTPRPADLAPLLPPGTSAPPTGSGRGRFVGMPAGHRIRGPWAMYAHTPHDGDVLRC